MKEQTIDLSEHLAAGMQFDSVANVPGWFRASNAKPMYKGCKAIFPYASAYDAPISGKFPQLIVTQLYKYICTASGVYDYSSGELIQKAQVNTTTHYDCADFLNGLILTGGQTFFRNSQGELVDGTNAPMAKACCNFNGIPILGNITSWSQSSDVGPDSIVWGLALGHDFTRLVNGVATGVGYARLRCGEVFKIIEWDKTLLIFGARGIVVMEPRVEPLYTFGEVKYIPCSIANKESVVKGKDFVLFIDSLGYLWKFDQSGTTRIGFSNLFKMNNGVDVLGSYNALEEEFYFSTDTQTFVYCKLPDGAWRMGQLAQVITSGGSDGTQFLCMASDPSSYDFEVVLDRADMDIPDRKTVYGQSLIAESSEQFEVGLELKQTVTGGYSDLGYSNINPEGICTIVADSSAFRFKFRVKSVIRAKVEGYTVKWKLSDKRNTRGYVNYGNKTSA